MNKLTKLFIGAALALSSLSVWAMPTNYTDLGVIGDEGRYTFSTWGSKNWKYSHRSDKWHTRNTDTELGIWNASGDLLRSNDDGGRGLSSRISINLDAGVYFLGMSQFNSFFRDDFRIGGPRFSKREIASLVLNIDGNRVDKTWAGGHGTRFDENAYYRVEVVGVPEPSSIALIALGIAGIGLARRRASQS